MIWRATRLLIRLRLRRFGHTLGAGLGRFGRKKADANGAKQASIGRTANAGKRRPAWLIGVIFAPLMLFSAFQLARGAIKNLLAVVPQFVDQSAVVSPSFTLAIATLVLFLWSSFFLLSIASRGELSAPEWDMAWLATLPVPTGALLIARIFERSVVHAFGYMLVFPLLTLVAWHTGWRWSAPIIGALLSGCLFVIGATLRTAIETWLRLRLNQALLRNVQAGFTVTGLLPMYLAMSVGTGGGRDPTFFIFALLRGAPSWLAFSPFGVAAQTALAADVGGVLGGCAVLVGQCGALLIVTLAWLRWELRGGFVAGGSRESARKVEVFAPSTARSWLTPIKRKELRLLARDRTFLVQTLAIPVVLVGSQWMINPGAFEAAIANPRALGAAIFGIGAYTLCFSALQTLNAEGQALWMLFASPVRIDKVLIEKGLFWGALVLFWPAVMVALLVYRDGALDGPTLAVVALVAVGLPIYGVIASCLGVFACRPLAVEKQKRIDPAYFYLFLLLSSLHTYAIFAQSTWARVGSLALSSLLAVALWQKATDRLPYLLDPDAAPPPTVSLSDGLIAVQSFFVVQGLVMIGATLAHDGKLEDPGAWVLVAFCSAGALTWTLAQLLFWRAKTVGVPRILGAHWLTSTPLAIVVGLLAAALGVGWTQLAAHTDVLPDSFQKAASSASKPQWWLAALAIIAAPLFEEFIFRGLVFRGLRRSYGLMVSVLASSAIFALVHPPISVAPVFVLGCACAWLYERSGSLATPMIAHGVYNGALVTFALATN